MSDNNQQGKIPVIPGENTITVELTPVFMQRIQLLATYLINMYGQDKFLLFVKKVQEEDAKPENELEEHIQTVSALMVEFETNARDQNKVKWLTPQEAAEQLKNNPLIAPIIKDINGN